MRPKEFSAEKISKNILSKAEGSKAVTPCFFDLSPVIVAD